MNEHTCKLFQIIFIDTRTKGNVDNISTDKIAFWCYILS